MSVVWATKRYWIPLVVGFLLPIAAIFTGPVATWLMLTTSFGLLLDGTTALFEKAGGAGNLTTYKP